MAHKMSFTTARGCGYKHAPVLSHGQASAIDKVYLIIAQQKLAPFYCPPQVQDNFKNLTNKYTVRLGET